MPIENLFSIVILKIHYYKTNSPTSHAFVILKRDLLCVLANLARPSAEGPLSAGDAALRDAAFSNAFHFSQ